MPNTKYKSDGEFKDSKTKIDIAKLEEENKVKFEEIKGKNILELIKAELEKQKLEEQKIKQ